MPKNDLKLVISLGFSHLITDSIFSGAHANIPLPTIEPKLVTYLQQNAHFSGLM